jgi:hypothetical protein
MALNTYATLQSSVSEWLKKAGDPTLVSRIPDFIALAEEAHKADLRLREMQVSETITITAGSGTFDLSTLTRYLELRSLQLQGGSNSVLTFASLPTLLTSYANAGSGEPQQYTIDGDNLIVRPTADGAYNATIYYYQAFEALSDSNQTNALLTRSPGAYLYGTLLQTPAYLYDDARIQTWQVLYSRAIEQLENQDNRSLYNGASLTINVDGRVTP